MLFHKIIKHIAYFSEFMIVMIMLGLFYILPFAWASQCGGWLSRKIGPKLPVTRKARRHIHFIMPDKTPFEIECIVGGMWENLGRTISEYMHLSRLNVWHDNSPIDIVNGHIIDHIQKNEKPVIFFLGHLANWEYATLAAKQKGLKISQLYRTVNNPYVAWLVKKIHSNIAHELIPKGAKGARECLAVLKRGDHVSMLVDQKLNEGLSIPFMGFEAMTPTGLAKLALKFQCDVIPVRVERLKDSHCRVTYYPPLVWLYDKEMTHEQRVYHLTQAVNDKISEWINARPQDWMWVHNRWPKSLFKKI